MDSVRIFVGKTHGVAVGVKKASENTMNASDVRYIYTATEKSG